MRQNEVAARVVVEGKTIGVEETTQALRSLSEAQDGVAKSGEAVARVNDTMTKRQLSVAEAVRRLDAQLDDTVRSQQMFERGQRTLDQALQQGMRNAEQYGLRMQQLRDRYDGATIAARADAQAAAALKARIDPLGAAQARLNVELAEYAGLASRGAIGAGDLSKAQALARADFDATAASIRRLNVAANDNAHNFNTANLAYQLQDIGVTAGMGMNPLMIALQQGPQISQSLTAATGGARALGAALMSVLSVTSLLTIGVVAVGAAAIQWIMSAKNEAEDMDKTMERHAETLKVLERRYGDVAAAAGELASEGGTFFLDAQIRIDERALRSQLETQKSLVMKEFQGQGGMLHGGGGLLGWMFGSEQGSADAKVLENAGVFTKAVKDLFASVAQGRDGLAAFDQQLNAIFENAQKSGQGGLTELYQQMETLRESARAFLSVAPEYEAFQAPINKFIVGIARGDANLQEFTAEVQKIGQEEGLQKIADQAIALIGPLVKILEAWKEIERARFNATEAIRDRLASERMGTGAEYFEQRKRQEAQEDRIHAAEIQRIRARTDAERLAAVEAEVRSRNVVKGRELEREVAQAVGREQAQIDREIADAARQRAQAADEQLQRSREEIELIGKSVGEVARLQAEYSSLAELRADAARTGRAIDEEEIAAIRQKAEELGRLAQKAAEVQLGSDLKFDQVQVFRSPIERSVAANMRQLYGDEYQSYMQSALANQVRITAEMEEQSQKAEDLRDTLKDAAASFLKGLFSGKDLLESIVSLGDRFASMNFDNLVEMLSKDGLGGLFGASRPSQSTGAAAAAGKVFADVAAPAIAEAIQTSSANDNQGPVWERTGRSVAQGIVPTLEKGFSGQIQTFMSALKQIESSNNYGAVGPMTKYGRPLGAYQVLPENVTRWSQEFLGRAVTAGEWMKDAALQDKVVSAKLAQLAAKFPDMKDWAAIWNSGRPLSQSANVRDQVFGTRVGDYVNKVMNAYDPSAVGRAVETGAKKGTSDGTVDAWAGLREVTAPSAASPQQAQNGLGQNLMSGLSAALGGFSTGYQSQNAGMGAFGGFLQGFGATGNIFGGILGGIAGFIGGMLGAKKKLEEAKKNLERNMKAIDQLLAVGEGRGIGENQKRITDFLGEIDKAVNLAWKAKEMDLVERLQDSYNIMFLRLSKDFENAAPGAMRGYLGGRGREDPEVKGAGAVFSLREELRNWIADFEFFGKKRLELTPDTPEKAAERAAIIARTEAEVAQATAAALQMVDNFLAGVEPLTELQQAFGSLKGAAETLMPTMLELGRTQEEAVAKIESQMLVAIRKLRDEFSKGLRADINEANGKGYLNDFDNLREALKGKRTDALTVGGEMGEVDAWFKSQAQSIVDGAQLIGPAFDQVIEAFPELEGVVTEFVDGIRSSSERLRDYEERLFSATTDTSTQAGALAAFERDAERQRAAERASAARDGIDLMVQLEKALAAERLQILEDFAERARQRILGYENRLFAANNDTSTLAGQLAAFDRAAQQERIEEIKAGGEGIAALERALAAERLKIERDFEKQRQEEAKRRLDEAKSFLDGWFRSLKEYVDNLKAGPESPLPNKDRLAEAQRQFAEQYAKALTGDRDAANSLTRYSDNVLDAAEAYYGSTQQFQTIFADIIAKLEAIPNQVSAEQFIVNELTEAIEENTTEIVTATDMLGDVLSAAFATGPQATANALGYYFDKIDRTADGLLTFDEIKTALAGKATDAQIQSMMQQLDLDGNGMISKLEALLAAEGLTRTTIAAAVNQGPGATAGLLAPYFNRLDTTMDGRLDLNELRAALAGSATDAQIRSMMTQLDTDMDKQISLDELIKGATQNTSTQLDSSTGVIRQLMDLRAITQEKLTGTNSVLLSWLDRGMRVLNSSNALAGGPGGFALGGRIFGPGSNTTDSIYARLSSDEFIVRTQSARSIGYTALDQINNTGRLPAVPMPVFARNDNNLAMLSALQSLETRMAAIERNTATTATNVIKGAFHVGEKVDDVTEAVEAGTFAQGRETLRKVS